MSTLYRPVKIETAEQAEALPAGTVAMSGQGTNTLTAHRVGKPGSPVDAWLVMDLVASHAEMANSGFTALVPIKVEVEQIRESSGRRRHKTLYVTPWALPTAAPTEGEALADGGDGA